MLSGEFQYIPMGAETWLHVSGGKEMDKGWVFEASMGRIKHYL